jgi:hypothetical protein
MIGSFIKLTFDTNLVIEDRVAGAGTGRVRINPEQIPWRSDCAHVSRQNRGEDASPTRQVGDVELPAA